MAGAGAVVGGLLWAVTPLRQPVLGAGRTPDEGVLVFRTYNLLLLVIAVLLTLGLLRLPALVRARSRLSGIGWWMVLVGHVLLFLGSLPAVLLGGDLPDLVRGGQDLGFLGALVAAAGALLIGLRLRRGGSAPAAAWLFLLTLPLGVLATVALSALGTPVDYLGLPLTLLYGGAWIAAGLRLLSQPDHRTSSVA